MFFDENEPIGLCLAIAVIIIVLVFLIILVLQSAVDHGEWGAMSFFL